MNQELFGTTPPKKLFIKLAIPSLVSMLFSSIYMMAYGMFVEKIKWNSNKNSIFY